MRWLGWRQRRHSAQMHPWSLPARSVSAPSCGLLHCLTASCLAPNDTIDPQLTHSAVEPLRRRNHGASSAAPGDTALGGSDEASTSHDGSQPSSGAVTPRSRASTRGGNNRSRATSTRSNDSATTSSAQDGFTTTNNNTNNSSATPSSARRSSRRSGPFTIFRGSRWGATIHAPPASLVKTAFGC